jgi:hypothetical protein
MRLESEMVTGNFKIRLSRKRYGFSLAEILASLTIGAMILVAGVGLYRRAESSVEAVTVKLESSQQIFEVLQRIAEDIDKMISSGSDAKITIENKMESHGYPTAKLVITQSYYGKDNKKETFEEITWQGNYDLESFSEGLVLYRRYRGVGLEDKLLDKSKADWEKELFVPVCPGITFFKIEVLDGNEPEDKWSADTLPKAIAVTISFAKPFEAVTGGLDVPEEEKATRKITIDRTRKIKFTIEESNELSKIQNENNGLTQKKQLSKP